MGIDDGRIVIGCRDAWRQRSGDPKWHSQITCSPAASFILKPAEIPGQDGRIVECDRAQSFSKPDLAPCCVRNEIAGSTNAAARLGVAMRGRQNCPPRARVSRMTAEARSADASSGDVLSAARRKGRSRHSHNGPPHAITSPTRFPDFARGEEKISNSRARKFQARDTPPKKPTRAIGPYLARSTTAVHCACRRIQSAPRSAPSDVLPRRSFRDMYKLRHCRSAPGDFRCRSRRRIAHRTRSGNARRPAAQPRAVLPGSRS